MTNRKSMLIWTGFFAIWSGVWMFSAIVQNNVPMTTLHAICMIAQVWCFTIWWGRRA